MMGLVHIYCGDGKGKTTASIGLSIRAAGSGMRVLFVQFFKNGHSSEIKAMQDVPRIVCMVEEKSFGRYKNMDDPEKEQSTSAYNELFDRVALVAENYDLIVLDEIISANTYQMISNEKLFPFLEKYREKAEIVLTGRNPSPELLLFADYVSEIKKIKHPYDKGIKARRGIEL